MYHAKNCLHAGIIFTTQNEFVSVTCVSHLDMASAVECKHVFKPLYLFIDIIDIKVTVASSPVPAAQKNLELVKPTTTAAVTKTTVSLRAKMS